MKKLLTFFSLLFFTCFFACVKLFATVVVAGSDFQGPTDAAGAKIVADILSQIKKDGYKSVDGVLYCGDYTVKLNNKAKESESGIMLLKNTLEGAKLGISDEKIILAQGNHDPIGVAGIAKSGENDPVGRKYGVFVINEDDFMWMQGRSPSNGNDNVSDDEAQIKKTAEALEKYLAEKEKNRFRGPIFVISHLPLHYSMRTYNDGDGRFSKYIFDVLNRYGKRGLKLVFLFGHNHSHGWDNYLGSSLVFLSRGDKIMISDPSDNKKCKKEGLLFTYMNAGYNGYFTTDDPDDGAEKILSMTLFDISPDGNFVVKRYSSKGREKLKACGVPNTRKDNQETKLKLYVPDTRERQK